MEERKKGKNVENNSGRKTEKSNPMKKTSKSAEEIVADRLEIDRINSIIEKKVSSGTTENRMQNRSVESSSPKERVKNNKRDNDILIENRTAGKRESSIKKEARTNTSKVEKRADNSRVEKKVEFNNPEKIEENRVQKPEDRKTGKKSKKRKLLTAILIILITLLLMVAGFFLGKVLYKHIGVDNSQINEFMNNLNGGNHNEEENILENTISEPSPTPTEEPTSTPTSTDKVKDIPYYIKVNYGANTVTVYKKDKNGEYKTPFKAFICSTGTATPTSGVYPITDQYTWRLLERKCIWSICL